MFVVPKPTTPTMIITDARAAAMYKQAMQDLYGHIQQHPCPTGEYYPAEYKTKALRGKEITRKGFAYFCEMTGLSRQNLSEVLAGKTGQDMSVGTYLRCAEATGLIEVADWRANVERYKGPAYGFSFRLFLQIDSTAVKDSLLVLNLLA